ncbi:MAG: hypothetical protein K0S41_4064, partial [Anaerocolumna sp.]|nr:hypothetical protein [Anaerocolumna sp.]
TTTVPFVNFNSNNSPSPGYSFAGYKCDSCNKTIVLLNFFYNTGSSSQTIKNWIVEIPTSELYSAFAPVLNNAYNHIKNTSMITYTSDGSGHFTFFGVENAMNYMISSLKTANYSPIPTVDTVYKNYITTVSIGSNWPYNYLNITNGTKHYTIKPATPICDKVVTNITATNPSQTVNQGDSIITTATATYLDGHTGVVNCTSNYNENLGTQIVTLTYSGLVDNAKTTGTKSCSSTVITKSKDKPIGLSIIPSSSTVYNGTEPTYTVKVLYENNTSKVITSGYTKTGFTRGAGTKNVTFSYTENSITVSNTITIQVLRNLRVCPNGHSYELDDFDNDFGCPICAETIKHINVAPDYITIGLGMSLDINITITYLDEHTSLVKSGWSSNYNPNVLGKQLVTVSYKGKETTITVNVVNNILCPICGTEYAPNDDGTDPGCPICSTKVIRIEATPNNQTVHVGEGIQLEVTATFQDGHKEKVNGWTSNFSSYKVGVQTVIVVYKNITTTVYVTVESESETTCPICGTKYSIIENPNGCPVCSKIVDKIEARLRNGGTKVQYGSDLNLYVILVYRDGHREIAYNGWSIEGYQPNVLGEQTILVKYNDLLTNLTIEVVNTLSKTVCPNGHVYYLNDDGSNPGCPYCTEDNKQFPDDYFDLVYTSSILDELYKNDIYYFDVGDYITVNVIPKSFSVIQKLIKIFHLNEAVDKKFSYGGMITFGEYI